MISAHSLPDLYPINEGTNQGLSNISFGYNNIRAKTQLTSLISSYPAPVKCIVTGGQSNFESGPGPTTYTTVSPNAINLNIYDGGLYAGSDPVLGPVDAYWITGVPGSSVNMRLADNIISQGKAATVVVAPIAVGGTSFSQWLPSDPLSLFNRITTAILRCRFVGLEPDCIVWGQGETDAGLNTPSATITAQVQTIVDAVRTKTGFANPFYIGLYTTNNLTPNPITRTGLINSVSVAKNIKLGFDCDTLLGGFRLPDNVHLNDAGLAASATGWQQTIFP